MLLVVLAGILVAALLFSGTGGGDVSSQTVTSADPAFVNAASFLAVSGQDPDLIQTIWDHANSAGVDPYAVLAIAHQENSFHPGQKGAIDAEHYAAGDGGHSHGVLQVDDQFHEIDGQGGFRGFVGADPSWDAVGDYRALDVGIAFLGTLINTNGVSPVTFWQWNGTGVDQSVYALPAFAWYELNAPGQSTPDDSGDAQS